MNFDDKGFDDFEYDMKNALNAICAKHKLKLKGTRIKYGTVDFEMKLYFEKDEEGINSERIKFETDCSYYGFTPNDYLRVFEYMNCEYELTGFQTSAKKYNCIVRNILTGEMIRISNRYLRRLFDEQPEQMSEVRMEAGEL